MGNWEYSTLREQLVDAIRVKILNGELELGARIIENELSQEFGVSRGPIREALRQIEQEGLIEYKRNAGYSVSQVTSEDIQEIYLLSSTYEVLAITSYSGEFTDEDFQKMEEVLEQMKNLHIIDDSYNRVVELDCSLHRIFVEKSGLNRLIKSWNDLNYGNILSCYAGERNPQEIAKRQYPIHRKLVDACYTKDVEKISEAIYDHYLLTHKRLVKEGKI